MSARFCIAVLFALLIGARADADDDMWSARNQYADYLARATCQSESSFYDAHSKDAPAPVAAALSGRGSGLVFRVCPDGYHDLHYFLRTPRRNPHGVCRVFEEEVFLGTKSDDAIDVSPPIDVSKPPDLNAPVEADIHLAGWTRRVPETWQKIDYAAHKNSLAMLLDNADAACPVASDPRYMTMNASDGMYRGFLRLWRAATVSPRAFDRVFGSVYVQDVEYISDLNPKDVRDTLRRFVFEDHDGITKIDCERGSAYGTGCNALLGDYWIHFDVGESGRLEIQYVDEDIEDGPL